VIPNLKTKISLKKKLTQHFYHLKMKPNNKKRYLIDSHKEYSYKNKKLEYGKKKSCQLLIQYF
jgi:hypothetical protein